MAGLNNNLVTFSTDFTNITPTKITQSPKQISIDENRKKNKIGNKPQPNFAHTSIPTRLNKLDHNYWQNIFASPQHILEDSNVTSTQCTFTLPPPY
jgi:hypothetical protein